jgi:hypothetical protein
MSEPLEITLREVRRLADELHKPDDDVFPQVIIVTPWEVKVVDADVRSDAEKTALFRYALPDLCARLKAHTVIQVGMAWFVAKPLAEAGLIQRDAEGVVLPPDGVMPRNHPDRKEMLLVSEVTATATTTYSADVVRSANMPPLFGELTPFESAENFILRHARRAIRAAWGQA